MDRGKLAAEKYARRGYPFEPIIGRSSCRKTGPRFVTLARARARSRALEAQRALNASDRTRAAFHWSRTVHAVNPPKDDSFDRYQRIQITIGNGNTFASRELRYARLLEAG